MKKPKKVAVLMGGASSEREISLKTGKQVSQALLDKGYYVKEIDPAFKLIEEIEKFCPDVVFIALHGKYGEDGAIQGLLEILGYPYTGSGVLASALAMDKVMSKKLFLAEGIKTPPFKAYKKDEVSSNMIIKEINEVVDSELGYPLVIKPACQGSTIGISIVKNKDDFESAIENALSYDNDVLIEKFIAGTEVTASVLEDINGELRVLPIIEIVSETGFYDYAAKYSPGLSHHIIPARISLETSQKVEFLAVKTFCAMNCRQFARIDFIIDEEGIPFVLEVNTIPGMTETSLFPDAARMAGITFPELISKLVDEAWYRHVKMSKS